MTQFFDYWIENLDAFQQILSLTRQENTTRRLLSLTCSSFYGLYHDSKVSMLDIIYEENKLWYPMVERLKNNDIMVYLTIIFEQNQLLENDKNRFSLYRYFIINMDEIEENAKYHESSYIIELILDNIPIDYAMGICIHYEKRKIFQYLTNRASKSSLYKALYMAVKRNRVHYIVLLIIMRIKIDKRMLIAAMQNDSLYTLVSITGVTPLIRQFCMDHQNNPVVLHVTREFIATTSILCESFLINNM